METHAGSESGREKIVNDLKYVGGILRNSYNTFGHYKKLIHAIPTRQQLSSLLQYSEIDAQKVYYPKDELKLQLSKIINNVQYFVNGKTQFVRHEFKLFDSAWEDKKPTYSRGYVVECM